MWASVSLSTAARTKRDSIGARDHVSSPKRNPWAASRLTVRTPRAKDWSPLAPCASASPRLQSLARPIGTHRARVAELVDAMDSKSIALRGIGVQVPSLVPPPGKGPIAGPSPWGRALALELLPTLLARVTRLTRRLGDLSNRLRPSGEAGGGHLEEALEHLAEGPDDLPRRTGWCFACLGTLLGHDLLLARREPLGPLALAELVLEARGKPPGEGATWGDFARGPLEAAPRGAGFEVALLLAECVREATGDLSPSDLRVEGELDPEGRARITIPGTTMGSAFQRDHQQRFEDLIPGTRLGPVGDPLVVCFDSAWLRGSGV